MVPGGSQRLPEDFDVCCFFFEDVHLFSWILDLRKSLLDFGLPGARFGPPGPSKTDPG